MVSDWEKELGKLREEIKEVNEKLHTLREDEWKAKETLGQLRRSMLENKRTLRKSNIPGLSVHVLEQIELGEKKLSEATTQLELVPLEMGKVAALVDEALDIVQKK